MTYFKTLYLYELKKIAGRRIFRIAILLSLLATAALVTLPLTGKYYVDGEVADTHYHMFLVDSAHEKALSGRAIDQSLLEETLSGYEKIKDIEGRYTLTEEYQTYARPYSAIFQLISRWVMPLASDILQWEVDENAFYEARLTVLQQKWQDSFLTEGEKAFWLEKETEIATPFIYQYHEGYSILLKAFNGLGILVPLFIAVCLCGVFSEEHVRRTDQLILTGVNGRTTAYLAKLSAGITVSLCASALMVFTTVLLSMILYGAEGFGMQIQATHFPFSYPMTIGQSCLILGGVTLVTAVLLSVFVMLCSEVLRGSIATLAVSTGFILLVQMFSVPPQYRVLSQIWEWLPFSFLNRDRVFDMRTLPLFGHCFVSWQIVPVLYLLFAAGIMMLGKKIYQGYQVTGR